MTDLIVSNAVPEKEPKLLDFKKNKTQLISFSDLCSSVNETLIGQKPINGVRHCDLISSLIGTFYNKYEVTIPEVYVSSNGPSKYPGITELPMMFDKYQQGDPRTMIMRRVLALIEIKDFSDDEMTAFFGVSFHQDGIEIAFGPKVRICQNLCILGKANYVRTYGNESVPLERFPQIVNDWVTNFEQTYTFQKQMLNGMKQIPIGEREMMDIIGELTAIRVARDSSAIKTSSKVYPLNQTQINAFTERYLKKAKPMFDEEAYVLSLYDIYNLGTEFHKPMEMEIPNIFAQNNQLGQYLAEYKYKDKLISIIENQLN